MRQIARVSVRLRLLVVAAAVAVLVVGVSRLDRMPVEVLPDFTPTSVEVQTEALGLSAAEVEQLVTVPLEQDLLNGIAFLDDIRSESVPGLSRILLVFKPGTGIFKARQLVAERLTQAHALPQVSKPPRMLQPLSSTDRVLLIGMSSKRVTALRMGVLARFTIAPKLVGVPGVANVSVWGEQDRQLQVQVDPARLRDRGVGLDQVIESTANALWVSPLTYVEASTPGTGGFVDTPQQRLGIQHVSPISTPRDLAKVGVEGAAGLALGDVANVVESHQPLIGDGVVADRPGLLLVVQRLPGANLLDVTRGLERAIDELTPGLNGIELDTSVYRPASYVERSTDNVTIAFVIGLGLLALVLTVLLGWRAAVVGVVAVPLSLLSAALVLWAFGETLNVMLVLGLAAAVALVVDDAVADATARNPEATLAVRRAALYATLIAALAVVPVFFLKRLSGAFFPDIAGAYLVALLASLLVAFIVTPALCDLLRNGASPAAGRIEHAYAATLSRILQRPRFAYLGVLALVALAAVTAPFLHQSLLPSLKESDLLVTWNGPPGTSLPEMSRITRRATRELRALPGVRDVGGHVGRAVTGDQIVNVNSAEMWVRIDPGADYGATVAAVRHVIDGYPGLSHQVMTYSQERVRRFLASSDDDMTVRVYGEDLATLGREAAKVRGALSGVDGISAAHVVLPPEQPTLQVRVDLGRAAAHGLEPGAVRRAATTLVSGLVVGSLFQEQKVFDVVVWAKPSARDSLASVRRLLIDTPEGGHVRLGDVANVRVGPSPSAIEREGVSRYVDVGIQVDGRGRGAVAADVRRTLAGLAFPLEYHAEVLETAGQPMSRLISIAIAAAIAMFLLLQAFAGSWRVATFALVTLPLGVLGGLAWALAADLSFGTYIALAAVFGVVARNSVLLLSRIQELEREGRASDVEAVLDAARERAVPTMTAALATALFFTPVLVIGAEPGLELLQPAAVVLVGGVLVAALFGLFLLPALYLRFGLQRAKAPDRLETIEAPALPTLTGEGP